jgi:hypothetical protein
MRLARPPRTASTITYLPPPNHVQRLRPRRLCTRAVCFNSPGATRTMRASVSSPHCYEPAQESIMPHADEPDPKALPAPSTNSFLSSQSSATPTRPSPTPWNPMARWTERRLNSSRSASPSAPDLKPRLAVTSAALCNMVRVRRKLSRPSCSRSTHAVGRVWSWHGVGRASRSIGKPDVLRCAPDDERYIFCVLNFGPPLVRRQICPIAGDSRNFPPP